MGHLQIAAAFGGGGWGGTLGAEYPGVCAALLILGAAALAFGVFKSRA